jgi:hypothetical protein
MPLANFLRLSVCTWWRYTWRMMWRAAACYGLVAALSALVSLAWVSKGYGPDGAERDLAGLALFFVVGGVGVAVLAPVLVWQSLSVLRHQVFNRPCANGYVVRVQRLKAQEDPVSWGAAWGLWAGLMWRAFALTLPWMTYASWLAATALHGAPLTVASGMVFRQLVFGVIGSLSGVLSFAWLLARQYGPTTLAIERTDR